MKILRASHIHVLGLLAALFAIALPASAPAAESGVRWHVSQAAYPTVLVPASSPEAGTPSSVNAIPEYLIVLRNVGAGATSAPTTITQVLPEGITPAPSLPPEQRVGSGLFEPCAVNGPENKVTCTVGSGVPTGGLVAISVPIDVAETAASPAVSHVEITGGGANAFPASDSLSTSVGTGTLPFGFLSGSHGLTGLATAESGQDAPLAGSHPYTVLMEGGFSSRRGPKTLIFPAQNPKDIEFRLPQGLVVNPQAPTRLCTDAELVSLTEGAVGVHGCPAASQVGQITIRTQVSGVVPLPLSLYAMKPPPGVAAEFGFNILGVVVHIEGGVDGSFHLVASSSNILAKYPVMGIQAYLWGNPADQRHDAERRGKGGCGDAGCGLGPGEVNAVPLITMPTSCGEPLSLDASSHSWEGTTAEEAESGFLDAAGNPLEMEGCNALAFEPTITSQVTTNAAETSSGLEFSIHQPQEAKTEMSPGKEVACESGVWSEVPPPVTSLAIQWLRNGGPIPGATGLHYGLSGADAGTSLQCEVRAENGADGPGYSVSRPIVVNPAPSDPPPPIPAKPVLRRNLDPATKQFEFKCEAGSWTGDPTFAFEWFEDGTPVAGADEDFIEVPAEVGGEENKATVQCRVTGTNAGGAVVAFSANSSTPTAPEPEFPEATSSPTIFIPEQAFPRATAALKNAQVTLPEGMSLNPSAANGLGSCTEGQMGYAPEVEPGKVRFDTNPQTCPNSAKVGTLEATTPLLGHKLPGSIYVAKPFDNPFGTLIGIYLAVEDEESGIVVKLAGRVEANPTSGQLTATFEENPELPLNDITLHFFEGADGALTTPLTCGTHTTTSTLIPWSTPEGADVHPSSSFQTTAGCSGSEAQAPKTVNFTAGTASPLSGSYSPFVLRISRPDGSQHITGIETTLPEGLLGKLAGVSYCPESGIAQAISRERPEQGKLEQQGASCPTSSEVGTVQVTAGSGNSPIPVSGHAYLAGPYKGAPLSLVVIVPAVAGPFDLGTVVDRVALNVGEYDARIRAVADPLPTIREGIPLDVRSIELRLDRPSFTLNPTSCEVMAIEGSVSTQAGQSAPLNNRFQVGECGRLKFKPKLSLALKGGTKRNKHPALKSVITFPKGENANIAKAAVTLPASEFIDQAHIGNPCIRPDFAAGNCPKLSVLGRAKAWSPLLDKPLEGKVYFRSNGGERLLPDIVVDLNGQVHLLLVGFVDSVNKKGSEVSRLRTTFAQVPDAPVSRFVLELKRGKEGLLVNSGNLCKVPDKAVVKLTGQNGKTYNTEPTVANDCKGKGAKKVKGKYQKRQATKKRSLLQRFGAGW